jgi:hypothetical protein
MLDVDFVKAWIWLWKYLATELGTHKWGTMRNVMAGIKEVRV